MRPFGFGFGAGRHAHPGGAAPAMPLVAPGHLVAVSTAPAAVYGAQRLAGAYAGPLFQLRRGADGATRDVSPQPGGDYPDYAEIVAWLGGSAATVSTVYDQTGNGRHLTQATVANQPGFDPAQMFGNVVPILFDGYGRSSTGGLPQAQIAKTMSVGGLALDLIANSIFMTVQSKVSYNGNAFVQGTDDAVSSAVEEFFNLANGNVTLRTASSNQTVNNGAIRATIDTIGFNVGATLQNLYTKEAISPKGVARSTTAIPRLTLGSSIAGGAAYNGMYRLFGMAIYGASLNTTDGASVQNALNTAFAAPTTGFDYGVVFTGDSIMEGSGGLLLRNMPYWLGTQISRKPEIFNLAVHGQTLASDYATRTKIAALFRSGVTNVAFVEAGTNDLGQGATGATLYANTTIPYITYLKGLGYKVVVCTLLPRADSGASGANAGVQTERTNYNALVAANSAGADYVLDLTQNPVMGPSAAPNNTTLFVDKLHPTSLGYRWLAGAPGGTYAGAFTYYYALQHMLGVVP
jgi:lysophospholipase L1-like esterase